MQHKEPGDNPKRGKIRISTFFSALLRSMFGSGSEARRIQ
jgi:hypothetical protein